MSCSSANARVVRFTVGGVESAATRWLSADASTAVARTTSSKAVTIGPA